MDASRDRNPGLPFIQAAGNRPPAPSAGHRTCPADGTARLPHPIRGVLFDMGNVLYDDTVWRRWVLKLLSQVGLHTNYRCFFRVWDRDYLNDVHRGQRAFCEAFEQFLFSAGLSHGQIDEVEAACQTRRHQLQAAARPLPGVKTTLQRLHKAGLALGILCNSEHSAPVVRQQLDRFGVGELFTTVVSSIDLKRTMPEAGCYLVAVKAMKLAAGEVAFVGHDAAELGGAAAVGMSTIAFNFDTDARADVYLARFEELLEVIRSQPPLAAAG